MNRRGLVTTYLLGLVALVLGLSQLHASVLARTPYPLLQSSRLGWALVLLAVLVGASYAVGLPELLDSRVEVVVASLVAVIISCTTVSLAQLALGEQLLPRSVLVLVTIITPLFSWLSWLASADLRHRDQDRARILVVAAERGDAGALETDLALRPELGGRIVAVLTPQEVGREADGDLLVDRASLLAATVVVLDVAAQADPRVVQQVGLLHARGVRIRTLSLFYEEWLGKLPLSELERTSLLFDIGELHRQHYVRARRVIDILFAAVGSVVLALAVPLVVLANTCGNRGSLLFRQERVGKGGVPFTMLKFRTMSGDDTTSWTVEGDRRITPVGRFLRRTHLDELPQVLNVLKGELSIVGPRPEQTAHVEELRLKIPFYDVRHLVRPGLTGWAQIKYGYTAHDRDALEKLQYDMYYLRRQGLQLDLRIIGRTMRSLVRLEGR